MSIITRTTDPELRDQLAEMHRLIVKARDIGDYLIRCGLPLTMADALLSDADGDVTGIFNDSQPWSAIQ